MEEGGRYHRGIRVSVLIVADGVGYRCVIIGYDGIVLQLFSGVV